jgi:hypothetical protein
MASWMRIGCIGSKILRELGRVEDVQVQRLFTRLWRVPSKIRQA